MLNLFYESPILGVVFLAAILITLTIHEFAHGATAYYYGDETAKRMGRLTFNPLAHLDLIGSLSFLFIGFGWGKPVPVNPYNFRDRKMGEIMTSVAGPLSNLVLAFIFIILLKVFGPMLSPNNLLYIFFQLGFTLNIALMLFNLIPVPPLDGSHILINILPDRYFKFKAKLVLYGPQILLLLIFLSIFLNVNIFGWIWVIIRWVAAIFNIPII